MKRNSFIVRIGFKILFLLVSLGFGAGGFFIRTTHAISIFTVTNTNDTGMGSFRQAILNANASPGFDIINFDIQGGGVKTIFPLTPLPIITDQVFIDGWSQGGLTYSGPPLIEISGINVLNPDVPGLRIGCFAENDCLQTLVAVDYSTVRGLIINGFPSTGNFQAHGIKIVGSNNSVRGCYIGTTANGEAALANGGSGIRVLEGGNNVIGGTITSARNILSGNLSNGITLFNSNDNRIQGNYVGLSASGLDLGNGGDGVSIGGSNNLVGGTSTGARNVISANHLAGIEFFNPFGALEPNADIFNNRIEGNYIGTKPDGVSGGVGNHFAGVNFEAFFPTNSTIGGLFPNQGNVISGNGGAGIRIFHSPGNTVQNNLIGVGADHTTNLGNLGAGIYINASDNRIGGFLIFSGLSFAAGNVIAFNHSGVRVDNGVENRILRNAIYSNGFGRTDGLGIDLGPSGVTANDFCDPDTGPNNLQNFPVITSVTPAPGGGIMITGAVSALNGNYRIEFFNNATCDPSGSGEGEQFLGSVLTTTVQFPFCRAAFQTTFPNISKGEAKFITATATDSSGNTSEFSACFAVH
jgi:hypothetical protein